MRWVLAGSLALIVVYAAVQAGTAGKVEQGGGLIVRGLRRAISPAVAGVPQRASYTTAGAGVAGVLGDIAGQAAAQGYQQAGKGVAETLGRIAGQAAGQG